jgi:hypothetical protein
VDTVIRAIAAELNLDPFMVNERLRAFVSFVTEPEPQRDLWIRAIGKDVPKVCDILRGLKSDVEKCLSPKAES